MHKEFECHSAVSLFKPISFFVTFFPRPNQKGFFSCFITCTSCIFAQTFLGQAVICPGVSQDFLARTFWGFLNLSISNLLMDMESKILPNFILRARFKIQVFCGILRHFKTHLYFVFFASHVILVLCLFHHFAALFVEMPLLLSNT